MIKKTTPSINITLSDFLLKIVYVFSIGLSIFISTETLSKQGPNQATWYRYYDKNGVMNISGSVSSEHIRYGYETLDKNMQVLNKNAAFNDARENSQSSNRTRLAIQNQEDLKLKQAYGSSQMAQRKRNDALESLTKKIQMQEKQLNRTQNDYLLLKKQESTFKSQGNSVPAILKKNLMLNNQNIQGMKKNIDSLQTNYRNTQAQYDTIIKRLKTFE